ncbi:MAG: hypothetical protein GXC73_09885, partial [Chitinophagaceae bacterium]|nr:hypothetical protein [Chitinophagaceae bacterium]
NAFKQERISDYQSNLGWIEGAAFKRRTANYTGVYDAKNLNGTDIKAIASNRNNSGSFFYIDADNNNKYIPIFETQYMTGKTLTATDYNFFYPNSVYTGFNVAEAKVVEKDIAAENGVIHVVDRVITSLPSIDQYIANNPDYSEFKKLMDRFLVQYVLNVAVTQNYKVVNGTAADVFTKVYNSSLAFSPNNENFLKLQDNDGQADTYTMFVPNNAALTNFINTVLLEHYPSVESLPANIIYDFVNAHMWRTAVWPTQFATTFSSVGEEARFNTATDIVDKKVLSNGIFYGTNKVQDANVFSSVYGKAYLDPKYSMMTALLNLDLKFQISNIRQKATVFLVSNQVLNNAGYFADPTVSNDVNLQWKYKNPVNSNDSSTGSSALVRLQRILNMHVVLGQDLTSLTGTGVAASYSGEFIKFDNNTVAASGNYDAGNIATVLDKKTARNGTVYYLDRILEFSEKTIGKHIEALGTPTTSSYNYFWQYLKNSPIFNPTTGEILQVASGSFYTFFVPSNAAILAAVNDGRLPGTGTAPNKTPKFATAVAAEREQIDNFIYYHILNKINIATDGQESGTFETLYKFPSGDPSTIFVNNAIPNQMLVSDMVSRNGNIIILSSNKLSNRCTIHLIDNYLRFN